MGFDVGGVRKERGSAECAADYLGFDAVYARVLEPELVLDGYGVLAGDDARWYPVERRNSLVLQSEKQNQGHITKSFQIKIEF